MAEPGGSAGAHPGVEALPAGKAPARVFVSHASADRAFAEALADYLEQRGIACWLAPRDVAPGALYAEAIINAISDAPALVLVLSQHAAASSHVGKELERASSKRRPIIAVRLDQAPLPPAFEYFLSESQWIEAGALGRDAAFAKLADALRAPGAAVRSASSARSIARPPRSRLAFGLAAIAVLAVIGASAFVMLRARQPVAAGADLHSIAVLPFADLSQAHDQEYFADGMAEEILDLLAKIPSLKVIARTSSFQFKGNAGDVRTIGERLGVATLLEGSVRKAGNHLRITAQLIRAADGSHLWSDSYDRDVSDVFRTQDEIAGAVVRALKVSLLGAPTPRAVPTTNAQAYALYLQGLDRWARYTAEDSKAAAEDFRAAVKLDPTFASGWAALSGVYGDQNLFGVLFGAPEEVRRMTREAAERAIALDPKLPIAHTALAALAFVDFNYAESERELGTALELEPGFVPALGMKAYILISLGELDHAIDYARQTIERDPLQIDGYRALATALWFSGHAREAQAEYREVLAFKPDAEGIHYRLAQILVADRQAEAALRELDLEHNATWQRVGRAMAFDALGRRADSERMVAEILKDEEGWDYQLAEIYAYRGDVPRAFEWLDRAYQHHDPGIFNYLRGDPMLASIRSDPRYAPLLAKMFPGR